MTTTQRTRCHKAFGSLVNQMEMRVNPLLSLMEYSLIHSTSTQEDSDASVLRPRGLCKDSNIEHLFTLIFHKTSVILLGLTKTEIRFSPNLKLPTWVVSVNFEDTQATIRAEDVSFALGKNLWKISNDSVRCNDGEPYKNTLKMSACSYGEFTCSNGDCVTMDKR